MALHPLAGQISSYKSLINVPWLISADGQLQTVVREKAIIQGYIGEK